MKLSPRIKKELKRLLSSEIQALRSLSKIFNKRLEDAVALLSKRKGKIIICGLGKSGHIGGKIASTMNSLSIPAVFVHSGDAFHGDLGIVGNHDSVIAISFSGETKELLRMVRHLKRHKIPVVAITGRPRSRLARLCDIALTFRIKEEGSPFNLAPMASTTATLVIGDLLAAALGIKRGFTRKDFADVHPGGSLGLQLAKVSELMRRSVGMPIVGADEPFGKAIAEMTKKKFGIAGVVNADKKLIGVITDGDIRRFLQTGKMRTDSLARDAMTRSPKTISRSASLQKAINEMEHYKITAIFIVDHRMHPVGMIHMHDIIEETSYED